MVLSNEEENIFEEFSKKFKSKQTKEDYLLKLILFKQELGDDVVLSKVTSKDCKKFMEHISKTYSTSTSEKIYSYLHSFFNYMYKNNYIKRNPFRYVKKPVASRVKHKDSIMSFDEIKKLIENIDLLVPRDRAIITFLMTTGCLLNEASNLRWHNLFSDEKGNKYCVFNKDNKERAVKLHPIVYEHIMDYRIDFDLPEDILSSNEFVFLTRKDSKNKITDRTIQNILKRFFNLVGLKGYSSKDFRHTFASFCIYLGIDQEDLKLQMGWSDRSQVMQYKYISNYVNSTAIDLLMDNKVFNFKRDLLTE